MSLYFLFQVQQLPWKGIFVAGRGFNGRQTLLLWRLNTSGSFIRRVKRSSAFQHLVKPSYQCRRVVSRALDWRPLINGKPSRHWRGAGSDPEPHRVRCSDGKSRRKESQRTFCLFHHGLGFLDLVMSESAGMNVSWFIMDSSIIEVGQAVVWQTDGQSWVSALTRLEGTLLDRFLFYRIITERRRWNQEQTGTSFSSGN